MSNQHLLEFLIAICIGSLTAYLAKERGRTPLVWFVVGLFFGLFGLIALFLFPIVKVEAVGIALASVEEGPKNLAWFYLDAAHKQYGPITLSELEELWEKEEISPHTYIWNEEMSGWKKIEEYDPIKRNLERVAFKVSGQGK